MEGYFLEKIRIWYCGIRSKIAKTNHKLRPIVLQFHSVHASAQFLTAHFPVTSHGLVLVSGVCVAAVM
jgi:hypothetical protein